MATLLVAEHDNKTLKDSTNKALTAAKAMGADVDVLIAGKECKAAADAAAKLDGVKKVLVADAATYEHQLAEPLAALIVSLAPKYDAIVAPATTTGKNVMPRVAALLDVMQISDITKVVAPDTFERPIYAGNAIQTVKSIRRKESDHGPDRRPSRRRVRAARRAWKMSRPPPIPIFRRSSAKNCRNQTGQN